MQENMDIKNFASLENTLKKQIQKDEVEDSKEWANAYHIPFKPIVKKTKKGHQEFD